MERELSNYRTSMDWFSFISLSEKGLGISGSVWGGIEGKGEKEQDVEESLK